MRNLYTRQCCYGLSLRCPLQAVFNTWLQAGGCTLKAVEPLAWLWLTRDGLGDYTCALS